MSRYFFEGGSSIKNIFSKKRTVLSFLFASIAFLLFMLPTSKVYAGTLADIEVFGSKDLSVNYSIPDKELTLTFTGSSSINVGVLQTWYSTFEIPPEIMDNIDHEREITGTYEFPLIDILFIEIPSRGDIKNIEEDTEHNFITGSVYVPLSVGLLPIDETYTFTMKIPLESMPPSSETQHLFHATVTTDPLLGVAIEEIESGAQTDSIPIPPAPTLNEVTDLDRVITGRASDATTVYLVEETEKIMETTINEITGEFSFTREEPFPAETKLVVFAQNAEGGVSEAVDITVMGKILTLSAPNVLKFKTTIISNEELLIPRQDPNYGLWIRDTRGTDSHWRITAKVLDNGNGERSLLSDYFVFVKDGTRLPLSEVSTPIIEGTTGDSEEITIQWRENEGILLYLNPMQAGVQPNVTYNSTIQWTIEDAP